VFYFINQFILFMKNKFLFFSSMLLFSINSQAQVVEEIYEAEVIVEEGAEEDVVEAYDFGYEYTLDSLSFKKGKPQVFLIEIKPKNYGYYVDEPDFLEKKELEKNFKSEDFDKDKVVEIDKTTFEVVYESGNKSKVILNQRGLVESCSFDNEIYELEYTYYD
jgi:hypothetical protein